jgi:3-oxoacyl-[acyl-carrier-protein] synthase-3
VGSERHATVAGLGSILPDRVVSNEWFESFIDTSDEWIRDRTGIRERHFAVEGETTSDLATEAARRALDTAGIAPEQVDLVVCATLTGDTPIPSTAVWMQRKLEITAPAFDINAACAGFSYGMSTATAFIESGQAETVLVAGAEILSRVMNFEDRSTCVLFGDGAGAVVLRAAEPPGRIGPVILGADGARAGLIEADRGEALIRMKGPDTFRQAVDRLSEVTLDALAAAGRNLGDVDVFAYHQANSRIIRAVGERLALPGDRVIDCVPRYGNTSAASIPIALAEARDEGLLRDGATVLCAAFGGGLAWGATVIEWGSDGA